MNIYNFSEAFHQITVNIYINEKWSERKKKENRWREQLRVEFNEINSQSLDDQNPLVPSAYPGRPGLLQWHASPPSCCAHKISQMFCVRATVLGACVVDFCVVNFVSKSVVGVFVDNVVGTCVVAVSVVDDSSWISVDCNKCLDGVSVIFVWVGSVVVWVSAVVV